MRILRIRRERIEKGLTQQYVGSMVGVTAEAILLIETGQRNPSHEVMLKLLDLFGYSDPRLLFAEAEDGDSETKKGESDEQR